MQPFLPLADRPLTDLLWSAIADRREGLVVLRDGDGQRHGAWTHRGFVVGIHVAGRFDPILDSLRRQGALDEPGYRRCVESLADTSGRAGALAIDLAGAPRNDVRDALKDQMRGRMEALTAIAEQRGHDARFEPGSVPESEVSIRMPLGALLPGFRDVACAPTQPQPAGLMEPTQVQQATRALSRKRLRALARKLHPDLNGHLDPVQRRQLELDLANATAAHHGLRSA